MLNSSLATGALLVCAVMSHSANATMSNPLVGPYRAANCHVIEAEFDKPSPLFLAMLRNQPRQADDFIRNFVRCRLGGDRGWTFIMPNRATGWYRTNHESCALLELVAEWLQRNDVHLSGRNKGSVFWGFWGTNSGNAADFANNINDCLRSSARTPSANAARRQPRKGTAIWRFGKRRW